MWELGDFSPVQGLAKEKMQYALRVSEQERLIREALPSGRSHDWRRALLAAFRSVLPARRQVSCSPEPACQCS